MRATRVVSSLLTVVATACLLVTLGYVGEAKAEAIVTPDVDSIFLPKPTLESGTVTCLFQGNEVGATVPVDPDWSKPIDYQFPKSDVGLTCEGVRVVLNLKGVGWENATLSVDIPFSGPLVVQAGELYLVSYRDIKGLALQAVLWGVRTISGASGTITAEALPYSADGSSICSLTWPDCSKRVSVLYDRNGVEWTAAPLIGGETDQTGLARDGSPILHSVDYATISDGDVYVIGILSSESWMVWNAATGGFVLGPAP